MISSFKEWSTQLFLRPFIQICANRVGFDVERPYMPASLFPFCEISEQEFSKIEDTEVLTSDKTTETTVKNQMNLFLEACRVSTDWCQKFTMV